MQSFIMIMQSQYISIEKLGGGRGKGYDRNSISEMKLRIFILFKGLIYRDHEG